MAVFVNYLIYRIQTFKYVSYGDRVFSEKVLSVSCFFQSRKCHVSQITRTLVVQNYLVIYRTNIFGDSLDVQ